MFANTLFTRMSSVNPAVKFRYVRAGLDIVGDHERAEEAREVYDYYKDLVTEIALVAEIDGSPRVGHGEPFGLFGAPPTHPRDRARVGRVRSLPDQPEQPGLLLQLRPPPPRTTATSSRRRRGEILGEQFDVQSVTFNHPDAHSRAEEEYGWRRTPYAYLLLRPLGPEVDRVPSLRLDLDFLDTTGYAVIPIESPPVPIDATPVAGDPRPVAGVTITQTLDERQASTGKLIVEVKATGRGLVPALDDLVDLRSDGFVVDSVEDQGVAVSEFDKEGEEVAVVADRTWMISMTAGDDLESLPESFRFGTAKIDDAEMEHLRYVDADLASVEPVVPLDHSYGEVETDWKTPAAGAALLLIALLGAIAIIRSTGVETDRGRRYEVPESLSPFTVIGLLRDIEHNNGLTDDGRSELRRDIDRIERYYYQDRRDEQPDLEAIARGWVDRTT